MNDLALSTRSVPNNGMLLYAISAARRRCSVAALQRSSCQSPNNGKSDLDLCNQQAHNKHSLRNPLYTQNTMVPLKHTISTTVSGAFVGSSVRRFVASSVRRSSFVVRRCGRRLTSLLRSSFFELAAVVFVVVVVIFELAAVVAAASVVVVVVVVKVIKAMTRLLPRTHSLTPKRDEDVVVVVVVVVVRRRCC